MYVLRTRISHIPLTRDLDVDKLGFLPTSFDPKLFYLRSDDVQRTTQSLEVLARAATNLTLSGADARPLPALRRCRRYASDRLPQHGPGDRHNERASCSCLPLATQTWQPSNPVLCPFQSNVTAAQSLSEEWMTHFKSVTTPLYAELANLTAPLLRELGNRQNGTDRRRRHQGRRRRLRPQRNLKCLIVCCPETQPSEVDLWKRVGGEVSKCAQGGKGAHKPPLCERRCL